MSFKSLTSHQTFDWYKKNTRSVSGALSHEATPTATKGRFAMSNRIIKTQDGQDYEIAGRCWSETLMKKDDKVVYNGQAYLVDNVKEFVKRRGQVLGYRYYLTDYGIQN